MRKPPEDLSSMVLQILDSAETPAEVIPFAVAKKRREAQEEADIDALDAMSQAEVREALTK